MKIRLQSWKLKQYYLVLQIQSQHIAVNNIVCCVVFLLSFKPLTLAQNLYGLESSFAVSLWPGVSSAESPWWLCLTSDDVWCLPPSPCPPATGPGSGTFGPSASVWSAWTSAGSASPPDGPGRPPTLAERCPVLGPRSEVYPRGSLALCWSAQRRAKTGHLSSALAGAMREIKKGRTKKQCDWRV